MSGSDQIDLKDIGFGPGTTVAYTGTSTGGMLTVGDAQHHTANIELAGNYTGSTFSLSNDGSGGTIVIDPAAKQDLAGGTLSFNDPAPTDTQTVTVSPQNGGAGYVGNFTVDAVTTANGQNSAAWHFNFESNPVAATVSQSYEVTVADHARRRHEQHSHPAGYGNNCRPGQRCVRVPSGRRCRHDRKCHQHGHHRTRRVLVGHQQPPAGVTPGRRAGRRVAVAIRRPPMVVMIRRSTSGNHDVITLVNVALSALHASDFIVH